MFLAMEAYKYNFAVKDFCMLESRSVSQGMGLNLDFLELKVMRGSNSEAVTIKRSTSSCNLQIGYILSLCCCYLVKSQPLCCVLF